MRREEGRKGEGGRAAVLVCSTDVEELVQVASRVLVLRRGVIGAELTGSELTVERIEEEQLSAADVRPTNEAADSALQKGVISNA